MLTFRLLRHSVLMLVHDPRATLRIWLPYLILLTATQFITVKHQTFLVQSGGADASPWTSAMVLFALLTGLVYLATGVSWHRYALLQEPPRLMAGGRVRQVLSYVGTGFLICLLILGLMVPMAIMTGALFATFGHGGIGRPSGFVIVAVMFLAYLIVIALALRLATAFPGAALRQPAAIRTAWRATRGHRRSFLALGLVYVVAQGGLALLSLGIFSLTGSAIATMLTMGVVSWAVTMLALSVLTTLWGYFVEGRDLR